MFENYSFILASQSPRRRELLQGLGVNFRVVTDFYVEENYPNSLDIGDIAPFLSEKKAAAYPYELSDKEVLIAADTLVFVGDKVLGKPKDRDEAVFMLRLLCGKRHEVVTGVTVVARGKKHTIKVSSYVTFKELTDFEILYYIDTFKPYDKAGGYAIQEWIGFIGIEKIEGSYNNIVGLPTDKLYTLLKNIL
ncbi:MAG: Maf family nucleotide pyrophosphatase [Rikenellaceae bacterium]